MHTNHRVPPVASIIPQLKGSTSNSLNLRNSPMYKHFLHGSQPIFSNLWVGTTQKHRRFKFPKFFCVIHILNPWRRRWWWWMRKSLHLSPYITLQKPLNQIRKSINTCISFIRSCWSFYSPSLSTTLSPFLNHNILQYILSHIKINFTTNNSNVSSYSITNENT